MNIYKIKYTNCYCSIFCAATNKFTPITGERTISVDKNDLLIFLKPWIYNKNNFYIMLHVKSGKTINISKEHIRLVKKI